MAEFNDYPYAVAKVNPNGKALFAGIGMPEGAVSEDGNLMIMDDRDNYTPASMREIIPPGLVPNKPSYVTQEMPNWPVLTHEEALQLVSYVAPGESSSEGWYFPRD